MWLVAPGVSTTATNGGMHCLLWVTSDAVADEDPIGEGVPVLMQEGRRQGQ